MRVKTREGEREEGTYVLQENRACLALDSLGSAHAVADSDEPAIDVRGRSQ